MKRPSWSTVLNGALELGRKIRERRGTTVGTLTTAIIHNGNVVLQLLLTAKYFVFLIGQVAMATSSTRKWNCALVFCLLCKPRPFFWSGIFRILYLFSWDFSELKHWGSEANCLKGLMNMQAQSIWTPGTSPDLQSDEETGSHSLKGLLAFLNWDQIKQCKKTQSPIASSQIVFLKQKQQKQKQHL